MKARGVALISVMLIVALATALVMQLMVRHSLTVAGTRQLLIGNQALEYVLGAEALARQILHEDWNVPETRRADTLAEAWAQPLTPFEIDQGTLEVQIVDLERRFNINSLGGANAARNLTRFKTLLGSLGLEPAVGDRVRDWVDGDREITGFGAEDGEYLLLDVAYRTANDLVADVSELRLLVELDADEWQRLLPNLSALPETELRLNINTAGARVVASLNPNMSPARAQSLVESLRSYVDVQTVTAEFPELRDSASAMSVTSRYFEIRARAEIDGVVRQLRSLVHRNPTTGELTVLRRDLGYRFESLFEPTEEI